MKKSLIALSVLAAVAGAAQAQSSVTVYGVLDMALQNENNGGTAGSKTALDSGIQSGSRLGFKGTEDLGGGLKANFQLEMGVNADTGASSQGATFGRQAWVGVSGDFGSVSAGRQYQPMFIAVDTIDPWGTGIIGGNSAADGGNAGVGTAGYGVAGFFVPGNPRINNSLAYSTNDMSGFSGSLIYGFGEQAGDIGGGRQLGASVSYNAGPVSAVASYHTANNNANTAKTKAAFGGATYDFGMAKGVVAYGDMTGTKAWMLGATVPVSAADAVIVSFVRATNKLASTDNHGNQFALGFTHSMSKRTNLYTSFSRVTNDAKSNAGGLAADYGLTQRLFNVGIRHKF